MAMLVRALSGPNKGRRAIIDDDKFDPDYWELISKDPDKEDTGLDKVTRTAGNVGYGIGPTALATLASIINPAMKVGSKAFGTGGPYGATTAGAAYATRDMLAPYFAYQPRSQSVGGRLAHLLSPQEAGVMTADTPQWARQQVSKDSGQKLKEAAGTAIGTGLGTGLIQSSLAGLLPGLFEPTKQQFAAQSPETISNVEVAKKFKEPTKGIQPQTLQQPGAKRAREEISNVFETQGRPLGQGLVPQGQEPPKIKEFEISMPRALGQKSYAWSQGYPEGRGPLANLIGMIKGTTPRQDVYRAYGRGLKELITEKAPEVSKISQLQHRGTIMNRAVAGLGGLGILSQLFKPVRRAVGGWLEPGDL